MIVDDSEDFWGSENSGEYGCGAIDRGKVTPVFKEVYSGKILKNFYWQLL